MMAYLNFMPWHSTAGYDAARQVGATTVCSPPLRVKGSIRALLSLGIVLCNH